jgi:hypothetical protein
MPVRLEGSCHCGGVRFAMRSHTPQPYQLCYCSICRKTAGGGGCAINLMAEADSIELTGADAIVVYRARIDEVGADGVCRLQASPARRHACGRCASFLWLHDPRWPELIHPFASAIDSELPVPPARVHLMLRCKPGWVVPAFGPDDQRFDEYPEQSIEDWHRSRGLWLE